MNKLILLLTSILFFSCSKSELKSKDKIELEINTFMNNWHINAKNADFNSFFEALDENAVFIGTDASENWTKKEFSNYSKPYFDKKKTWEFKTLERNIFSNKDQSIIWFDELVDSWMGVCRGSGVIEKTDNSYKIKQYIVSISVPNDHVKEVSKLKKETDSILISKLNKNK